MCVGFERSERSEDGPARLSCSKRRLPGAEAPPEEKRATGVHVIVGGSLISRLSLSGL